MGKVHVIFDNPSYAFENVNVSNDQEIAQSERKSHYKHVGEKLKDNPILI